MYAKSMVAVLHALKYAHDLKYPQLLAILNHNQTAAYWKFPKAILKMLLLLCVVCVGCCRD